MDKAAARDWIEQNSDSAMPGDRLEHRMKILSERAEKLARPLPQPGAARQSDLLLVFRAAGSRYGIPLQSVAEVLARAKRTTVPGAPDTVAGLIQVRGDICPVYHLWRRLGIARPTEETSETVLLLRSGDGHAGFLIESIEEVRSLDPNAPRLPPPASPHAAWMTDDLIPILDSESLINKEQ